MSTPPTPLLPVQQAVYTVLVGDPTLTDLISGVYDYVPETVDYPFVVVGEAIETPSNRHGGFGWDTVITVHVWSKYRGYSQALKVGESVTRLLDHQPLTVAGRHHVATRYEFGQTLTDPEPPGDIRHLVLRFRTVTEQTS